MTLRASRNLAHKLPAPRRGIGESPGRPPRSRMALVQGLASIFLTGVVCVPVLPAADKTAAPSRTPPTPAEVTVPEPQSPQIPEQLLQPVPAAGKGRLALVIGGNRRWC